VLLELPERFEHVEEVVGEFRGFLAVLEGWGSASLGGP
jgi:hypothetical protein